MTPKQAQLLSSLVNDTDFISDLEYNRPPLDDANYKQADGWEKCIQCIQAMASSEEADNPPLSRYVEVDKL